MLELAKSEQPIPIAADNFDRDDWLINCPNGTLDLRTNQLRQHDRMDFITKVCRVDYRPDAKCGLWLNFLNRTFAGDETLVRFVQQFFGICLTGDITAQYLPIFYGEGNNGKNVLLDTVCSILGEYAAEAPPGLLEASQAERHPTEIMDLMGKRLVISSETEHGKALRLQFIKRATGNATMKGRKMRQDFVEFRRTHKLILMTNNKPLIREDTEATWRRVRLVPFAVVIPKSERDPKLTQKLKDEWEGILAWMVRGSLDWQQNGLIEPRAVETATAEYRKEENPVVQFVEQSCATGSYAPGEPESTRFAVPSTVLWQQYKIWCEQRGRHPHGDQHFSQLLRHAVPNVEKKTVRFGGKPTCSWTGLRLNGVAAGESAKKF